MISYSPTIRILIIAFIVIASCILASPVQAAEQDSAQVSALLLQSRLEAIRLREDASQMQNFVFNPVTWVTHAVYGNMVAEDVIAMREKVDQLDKMRALGSDWQKTTIDQINPLVGELATTTNRVIETMKEQPFDRTQYNDYLKENYDCSKHLAALISESVSYGKTKTRLERIAGKLHYDQQRN